MSEDTCVYTSLSGKSRKNTNTEACSLQLRTLVSLHPNPTAWFSIQFWPQQSTTYIVHVHINLILPTVQSEHLGVRNVSHTCSVAHLGHEKC